MPQSILATYRSEHILPDLSLLATEMTRLSDAPVGRRPDDSPIPCDYFGYVERLKPGQMLFGHYRLGDAEHAVAVWYPQFQALEAEVAAGGTQRLGMYGLVLGRACALGMFTSYRQAYPAAAFEAPTPPPRAAGN